MINKLVMAIIVALAFLPFLLLLKLNNKANLKREIRCRQFVMPVVVVLYSCIAAYLCNKLSNALLKLISLIVNLLKTTKASFIGVAIEKFVDKYVVLALLIFFNTICVLTYIILKTIVLAFFRRKSAEPSRNNKLVNIFYEYNDIKEHWVVKNKFKQSRAYLKVAYYGGIIVSMLSMLISCSLYLKRDLAYPYYPVFAIIILGELAFYLDGLVADELPKGIAVDAENATHNAFYFLLRKALKRLFGDKLSADGTTINNDIAIADSVEDILATLENTGEHIGKNYYDFIKEKEAQGLKPNADYVKSGYELAIGKSLLFNTPFYYKLIPYVFYAMNRTLLDEGKVLIILGRHGTTEDLHKWCEEGLFSITNIPDVWNIEELNSEDKLEMPDIGIITRSGVHDLGLHRANKAFLSKVRFVFLVEPSRLVTTAQVGLNLLVRCFDQSENIVYCSVDKNCDGLVDSLSHILSANLTEVSPTEYAHGVNSYMCWLSDKDYIQHRLLSGVSRYLGMGTELSFVALKNQVETTSWFGGEAYPVVDQYWISKQYYHDLLQYAGLPTTQETYDNYFNVSYNLCNERVRDNVYITAEDEQNNLFEMKRIFATVAEEQGFVNVISSEYMLREYMAQNEHLFNADPKAIPYVAADFARTKRNVLLTLCLRLSIEGVTQQKLKSELELIGVAVNDLGKEINPAIRAAEFWNELCLLFSESKNTDEAGNLIIERDLGENGEKIVFKKEDVLFIKRVYNEYSGSFEDLYVIDNKAFQRYVLQDLEHARYVAERDVEGQYLGTELVGHILQKYLPGQLLTLNGKYYEMLSIVRENQVLLRRASEHIKGRPTYRQERVYTFERITNSTDLGALRTVDNIDIYYQYADFCVQTPAYWAMDAYNDFENANKITINGIPQRRYFNKQILKIDFSKYGEVFSNKIKVTLTVLINEVLRTMYAENQAYISAITYFEDETDGAFTPLTYRIQQTDSGFSKNAIYIIEDSQLDIGLLVSVERNLQRILQIVSDYLAWNAYMIENGYEAQEEVSEEYDELPEMPEEEPLDKKAKKKAERERKKQARKEKREARKQARLERKAGANPQETADDDGIKSAEGNADSAETSQDKKAQRKAEKERKKQEKAAKKAAKKEARLAKKASAEEKSSEEPAEAKADSEEPKDALGVEETTEKVENDIPGEAEHIVQNESDAESLDADSVGDEVSAEVLQDDKASSTDADAESETAELPEDTDGLVEEEETDGRGE